MARKFGTPIDMQKLEIQNFAFQNLASAPSSPVAGQTYYDTGGAGIWFYRNGSAWINPLARANHSGTQTASTISDLATVVQAYRLDQFAAPTADVSLNSHKITNLTDGVSAQDAVSVNQLTAVAQGRSFKDAVRAATTANGTLATAYANGSVIDGVTLATGDRILLKNQTTGADNGIYTVNASGAPTRSTDADTSAKVKAGMSVQVAEGTANADKQWTITTDNPITLGTTALVFAQTGAGTTYTQSTGITITGAAIAIDTTVTARHAAASIGDGSATSIAVTHSLGTLDVLVNVFANSDGTQIDCDITRNSTSQVTLGFAVAPTTNQYRVVVIG